MEWNAFKLLKKPRSPNEIIPSFTLLLVKGGGQIQPFPLGGWVGIGRGDREEGEGGEE